MKSRTSGCMFRLVKNVGIIGYYWKTTAEFVEKVKIHVIDTEHNVASSQRADYRNIDHKDLVIGSGSLIWT